MRLRVLEITDESRNAIPAQSSAAGRNTPLRLTSCMRSPSLREEVRMHIERIRDQGGLHSSLHRALGFHFGVCKLLSTESGQLFTSGDDVRLRKVGERLIKCATCRHLSACPEQSYRSLPDRQRG